MLIRPLFFVPVMTLFLHRKNGVTQTEGAGVTQTEGAGVTQTDLCGVTHTAKVVQEGL